MWAHTLAILAIVDEIVYTGNVYSKIYSQFFGKIFGLTSNQEGVRRFESRPSRLFSSIYFPLKARFSLDVCFKNWKRLAIAFEV